jgi:transposase
MINQNRIKSCSANQGELLPTFPSDLVSDDHPARILSEIVDSLDLRCLYSKYGWEGGEAFHPKSLLKILFYGYSYGDRSSRQLSRACRENFVYMYLGGSIRPDFRTISEFRKNHFDIIKGLFGQIVTFCYRLGMIQFGTISLDGTKIKANASKRKMAKKERLEKELLMLEDEISDIFHEAEEIDRQEDEQYGESNDGDEIPEKLKKVKDRKEKIQALLDELKRKNLTKMSLTDNDSRFMKGNGRIELAYNAQCATENQIVIAYDVNDKEIDQDQLVPMVEELEFMAGSVLGNKENPLKGSKLLADAGYDSGKNLSSLDEHQIDGYVANPLHSILQKEKDGKIESRPFTKDKFEYHEKEDLYTCPMGEKLYPERQHSERTKTYMRHEVRYQCHTCHLCPRQKECVKSVSGNRQVKRYREYNPYREKMDNKLKSDEGNRIYQQRWKDVEPVFGQIKSTVLKNSTFLVRGKRKVHGEFGLCCIVHNIKKMITQMSSGNGNNERNNRLKDRLVLAGT